MAAAWFLRLTGTAATWSLREATGRVAVVTCASNISVTYQADVTETGVIDGDIEIPAASVGEATITASSNVIANGSTARTGIAVVASTSAATVNGVPARAGTATVTSASTLAVTFSYTHGTGIGAAVTVTGTGNVVAAGRHGGQVAAAAQVVSSVTVNFGAGSYPDIPQITGTMKESTSGMRVPRTRAGKPFFINYYPRPRSVFKVIHECTATEKLILENRYTLDRMKSFTFTFASDGLPYVVNYAESPRYTPIEGTDRWRIESILIES